MTTLTLDPKFKDRVTFFASSVAGDATIEATFPETADASEVAATLATRLRLPGDVRWLLRKDETADVVGEGPIGGQIAARSHVELIPVTHLG